MTGECENGCEVGYFGRVCDPCPEGSYGENCLLPCPQCKANKPCDPVRGTCEECSLALEPPFCNNTCPTGYFGEGCSRRCGNCFAGQQCLASGICSNGCSGDDYQTPTCTCKTGYFGEKCDSECGHCAGGVYYCSDFDGVCAKGCQPGYQPPLCTAECPAGSHGLHCNETCGSCSNSDSCDPVTGFCSNGCQGDLQPPYCKPAECPAGFYGAACDVQCGRCKHEYCERDTSYCLAGCAPGYYGLTCGTPCLDGLYGEDCAEVCGRCRHDKVCFKESGDCPDGCQAGWYGKACNVSCDIVDTDPYCQHLWEYYRNPYPYFLLGVTAIVASVLGATIVLGFYKKITGTFNRTEDYGPPAKALTVVKVGMIIFAAFFTICLPYL